MWHYFNERCDHIKDERFPSSVFPVKEIEERGKAMAN